MRTLARLIFFMSAAFFLLQACSYKEQISDMKVYLSRQEHDPALAGWWTSTRDDNDFLFFNDEDFTQVKAHYGADGSLLITHNEWFWYTADGVLYSVKEASRTADMFEIGIEYRISEDGEILLERDTQGNFKENWRRSDACQVIPPRRGRGDSVDGPQRIRPHHTDGR